MGNQKIRNIKIEDLVLWTENPRDPIDSNAKDQDIVDMAIKDRSGLWKLSKLASQMGDYYDFSEIPIVVYENNKPIVFDGNRRVILAKLARGIVSTNVTIKNIPEVPNAIPCNVCDKETAINSVLRKHGTTGSWRPLERDRFIQKYKGGVKSDFMVIEEATGLISSHDKMNQGFVKDEVFSPSNLTRLGLRIVNGKLESQHSEEELLRLLNDLCSKIEKDYLSTRKSRGDVVSVLDAENKQLIEDNKNNSFSGVGDSISDSQKEVICKTRKTKRTKATSPQLFGKPLSLKQGEVNNLYRDICDLYTFYCMNKSHISQSFTSIIRMSLRLLCETAAKDSGCSRGIDEYVKKYFLKAKKQLSSDEKTLLSNNNVKDNSIIQLLQTGAHNYTSSQNFDQTLAISIVLGYMLLLTHGK
ncbi:MAG: hypothetical protein IKX71_00500 [Bacteroidales bacterium]|nr:hypothetical protein [Bacteroidales bacterium]